MKKVGIFGGAFNPIHYGHLAIAQSVLESLKLDKVIFVPSYFPPHKNDKDIISAEERYHMVELAIEGNSKFFVSDIEIKRGGKSYSIDTVKYLKNKYSKNTKLFFIIGGDNLATLHTWKDIDEILNLSSFVAVNRLESTKLNPKIKVKFIDMPVLDISSSFLRRRIHKGASTKYLLPEAVIKYIKKKKLYSNKK